MTQVFADVQNIIVKRVLANFRMVDITRPDANNDSKATINKGATDLLGNNMNSTISAGIPPKVTTLERIDSVETSFPTETESVTNRGPPMRSSDLEKL